MTKEKILFVGSSGLVGTHFIEKYSKSSEILAPTHEEMDLVDRESIERYLDEHPDITHIINSAAYTNLTEAQKQRGDQDSPCWRINVFGVTNLISAIAKSNIFFIQISTDYVFPGDELDPGPYAEDHPVCTDSNRLSYYGYSKAVAEQLILESLASRMVIFRLISPVVKKFERKLDFLRFPLSYYESHKELYPIFSDQKINITYADEFCKALKAVVKRSLVGIFHAGSSDITTPYEIMTYLFDVVYGHHEMVKPGSVSEYLAKTGDTTRYHKNGGLLNNRTRKQLGINYSSSKEIIEELYRGPN